MQGKGLLGWSLMKQQWFEGHGGEVAGNHGKEPVGICKPS